MFTISFVLLQCILNWCFALPNLKNDSERILDYENVISPNNYCNCVCGVSNRQMRVVGGNITRIHEFPWLVGLSKNGGYYCGGTLITRKHVLTAAHCIEGFDIRILTVALADHDRQAPNRLAETIFRGVKKAVAHKGFDSFSFNNDIAILEIDSPVEFDHRIQPACLPNDITDDYAGRLGIVAGWGQTNERESTVNVLRKVAVPVWKQEQCVSSGYGRKRITKNMFCAGYPEGKKDACQGDSGGPLNLHTNGGNMEVIGVVSWGRGCARPNLPGIYTKVNNYLKWIERNLDGECLCPAPVFHQRRV